MSTRAEHDLTPPIRRADVGSVADGALDPNGAGVERAVIVTPLGEVCLIATIDGDELLIDAASTHVAAGGTREWVWDGGVFRAELLCRGERRPGSLAEPGAGCETAVWRLYAVERPAECELVCRWTDAGVSARGGRDGGIAWARRRERGTRVSILTPDLAEALHPYPGGFVVSAAMPAGATFETRFVVTWPAGGAARDATAH